MPEREPVALDEKRALTTLDNHYAMLLRSAPSDLRRPGWTVVAAPVEADPVGLLFGQRMLVALVVPQPQTVDIPADAGVALVAPELRPEMGALLRAWPPTTLFTGEGRVALDALIRGVASRRVTTSPAEAHVRLCYAIPASFRPYLGQWLDWITPLDEETEMEPSALSLLARYSGGVYVVRDGRVIVSFAGIRSQSPAISELHAQTVAEALRGHGLGRAVASRATRAIFAAGRIPLFIHLAHDAASARLATALGYRPYAEAAIYTAALG
jgi:RimJ/RimL family protein N-acetyltransferase